MAPSSSFSETITISSISVAAVSGTGSEVTLGEFYMYMGYCSADQLNTVFASNYVSGSKTTVYSSSNPVTFTAQYPWTPITLQTPFVYDPSMGNLLIEIGWPNGSGQFYIFDYPTAGVSMVSAAYGAGSGDAFTEGAHLLIEGETSFQQMTFAGIKASFN